MPTYTKHIIIHFLHTSKCSSWDNIFGNNVVIFPPAILFFFIELIIQFMMKLNFRSTAKENPFTIFNAYNQVCSRNIPENYVIIYILFKLSSIYVALSLSSICDLMLAHLYMKIRPEER